jgi:hypothetical protein
MGAQLHLSRPAAPQPLHPVAFTYPSELLGIAATPTGHVLEAEGGNT